MTTLSRNGRAALAAAVAVLLLAALLRTYHITQQSLWFDEAFAWNIIQQPDMYPRIAADTHPPLYYVLLRGWTEIAGDSVLALRYLSLLFGMVTVALVYQIGAELARQRGWSGTATVALLAALLMALTDAEIDLAQEARNYTLYTMLACLSMWVYLRWLRRPDRWLAAVWILSTAALVYTHYQGAFIPFIQGLHALMFLRGRRRIEAIGALAAAGFIFLPWFVGVTIPQARNAVANDIPFSIPSNWETLAHLRREFFGAMWPLTMLLALAGIVTVVYADGPRLRWRPPGPVFLAAGWLLIPFMILFVGNVYAPLLTERKLAFLTPAIALLMAFGLGNLRAPAPALLTVALVIYGLSYVDSYRLKEPWDEIALDAVQYAGPHDLALIEVGNGQYPMKYYWERWLPPGAVVSTFPVLGDPTLSVTTDWFTYYDLWLPQLLEQNQAERVGDVATVWLAFWYQEQPSIDRLEAAGYVRTMTTTHTHLGYNIDLYRYDLLPPDPVAVFDSGMALRAVEIDADALRVDLWWSASQTPPGDYVTSAALLDENGVLVAQMDSVPFLGQRSTRGWRTDDVIFDPKALVLAGERETLPPGEYTVIAQVYRFVDGAIQHSLTDDGAPTIRVGTITR